MTKMEAYEAIKAMVAENEELVAFVEHEQELLVKRNSKKSDSMTKTQKENLVIKEKIVTVLGESDGMTATMVSEVVGITLAKATALLTQLVKSGIVERIQEKKTVIFRIAE